MATEEDLQQAWIDTRLAVLKAINTQVSGSGKVAADSAQQALDLSEAYAWLTQPAQPHGKGA
jgi:hypothetical protein